MNKRICDYCGENNPINIIKLTRRPNNEDTYAELCDQCLADITQAAVRAAVCDLAKEARVKMTIYSPKELDVFFAMKIAENANQGEK